MTSLKTDLAKIVEELKTQRDVLAVKIHLAKADVKDEWQELEKKWQHFSARSEILQDEAKGVAEDVREDLSDLGEDLKEGYYRIKRLLH
jgi:hypothetical protein